MSRSRMMKDDDPAESSAPVVDGARVDWPTMFQPINFHGVDRVPILVNLNRQHQITNPDTKLPVRQFEQIGRADYLLLLVAA